MARRAKKRRSPVIEAPKLAVLGLVVVLLGVAFDAHCRHYWPFLSDDALISFRYAERLTQGDGLTWNDGERVEGYSNLLWVLLVAGLHRLGIDSLVASRLLGFAGAYGAILAVGLGPRSPALSLPRLLIVHWLEKII